MHYALLTARRKALEDTCESVRSDEEFLIAEKAIDTFYDRILEEIDGIDSVVVEETEGMV